MHVQLGQTERAGQDVKPLSLPGFAPDAQVVMDLGRTAFAATLDLIDLELDRIWG